MTTGARAPLSLFPGPNVSMDQTQGPLDALAESSTERTPTISHVWFQLRLRPYLEASSDGQIQTITPTRGNRGDEGPLPRKTRYRAAKY